MKIDDMTEANRERIEILVRQAKQGDREAFSRLVRMMMQDVVALTYRMTGDRDTAADLAQDAFVSAWENLRQFREEAMFTSWVYRIAANKALNYLKKRAGQATASLEAISADQFVTPNQPTNPEREVQQQQMREGILEFMSALPPQQRLVFDLRFYKQLSFDEIARITGRAPGTVKTHYRQVVIKLREYAQQKGWHS